MRFGPAEDSMPGKEDNQGRRTEVPDLKTSCEDGPGEKPQRVATPAAGFGNGTRLLIEFRKEMIPCDTQ